MFIKSLELNNFRNYDSLSILFDGKNNILCGDNAQGKTNILEAIFVAGTTKSHKGSKDRELIKIGSEESHIRMIINKSGSDRRIDMHLRRNRPKGVAIDGIPITKSSELLGMVHLVIFSPEDLGIIKNGPGDRRRFLDMELCQIDRLYMSNLANYNKTVVQRNHLLKQIGTNKDLEETLDSWNIQLVLYGRYLIDQRKKFIDKLNYIVQDIHHNISGGIEKIEVCYEANVENERFEEKLEQSRNRDIFQKMTCVGPHRDDICILIDGVDIRKYGSQGQQRTVALALKLAEIEIVRESIGENPVLLLDDVMSELDRNRQNCLLNSIRDTQTIVTCTGLEELVENRFHIDKIYNVIRGMVFSK